MHPTVRALALLLGFLITPSWGQFETLFSFSNAEEDGGNVRAGLTVGPNGDLYGTTTQGGYDNLGTLFRYSPETSSVFVFGVFDSWNGSNPVGRIVSAPDGNLYGISRNGGAPGEGDGGSGTGTVYKVDLFNEEEPDVQPEVVDAYAFPDSGNTQPEHPVAFAFIEPGVLQVLCDDPAGFARVSLDGSPTTFSSFSNDNRKPTNVLRASNGSLYGGTLSGGAAQLGTLFRVAANGTGWTVLHECTEETGTKPIGAMVEVEGSLYGLMSAGGSNGHGVLFRISLEGAYEVVHEFTDFREMTADLIRATDGFLYGTGRDLGPRGKGAGGVFRIRPDGSGYKALHVFATRRGSVDFPDGKNPYGGVTQGADGYIYGTTEFGPNNSQGSIFRLKLKLPLPTFNRPPLALDDLAVSDGETVSVNVLANDYDPDGGALTVSIDFQPSNGTAAILPNGSIVYTPNEDYEGWDEIYYRVTDEQGAASSASVTIQDFQPESVEPGVYHGLLRNDPFLSFYDYAYSVDEVGQISVTLKDSREFTGTIVAKKKRVPFRGTLDASGNAEVKVKQLPGQGPGSIFLSGAPGTPGFLNVAVYGWQSWTGRARLGVPSGFHFNKIYTVQISPDPDFFGPAGGGYGIATVKPNGSVSIIGKLGDGTSLKLSTAITAGPAMDGDLMAPFYMDLPNGGKFVGEILQDYDGDPGYLETFSGFARWIRPAIRNTEKPYGSGFYAFPSLRVAPYNPPAIGVPVIDFSTGLITISRGEDSNPAIGAFLFGGAKFACDLPLRALKVDRKNGLFSGTMLYEGKPVSFKGVLDQGNHFGLGHAMMGGVASKVELTTGEFESFD
jgi:uncharacterized repeat protein (TIGR03803 family)